MCKTYEYVFFECSIVKPFWTEILLCFNNVNLLTQITWEDVLLGDC